MQENRPLVSIIMPVYNCERFLSESIESVISQSFKNWELLIVDDGSKDKTSINAKKTNAHVIDLPFNLGIGGAVQTGYKYALYNDYDIAIQFDGDGQHDASYIPNLVEEIEKGNDIVIGSRFVKELSEFKSTFIRRLGIKWLSLLIKICTRKRIYDPTSGFRACNKKVIKEFATDYPIDYKHMSMKARVLGFCAVHKLYPFVWILTNLYKRMH